MSGRLFSLTLGMVLVSPSILYAAEPMTVPIQRMTADIALRVVQGALTACREKGVQIAAAVVDRDGVVQAAMRDTIAAPITLMLSQRKAYTAANFNADLTLPAMQARVNTAVGQAPGISISSGGLPIEVGGNLLGAVGVSGGPEGKIDKECAQAGINSVKDDLEMAM